MSTATKVKDKIYEDTSLLKALHKNYAVIEFTPEGNILCANDNFFKAMGYSENDVIGKHHRIFCDSDYAESLEYKKFWKDLSLGESKIGEFKRYTKDKRELWLSASYTPICDSEGKVIKVVKFAQDNTEKISRDFDFSGKINAIDRAQAIIEFNLDGVILSANENFLQTVGYTLDEIKGKHHKIFCDPEYVQSNEYKKFWQNLSAGKFSSGEYKRFGKNGEEVWINASYNPIFDGEGNPFKVVKFASNITEQKIKSSDYESKINAIDKSLAAIEFSPDGTIL